MIRASRIFAVVLVIILLAAACGGDGQKAVQSATPAAELSGTLVIWDAVDDDDKAWPELNRLFMDAHPKVTIEFREQPIDGYFQQVTAANAARTGPDVLWMQPGGLMTAHIPALQPLNDLIPPEMLKQLSGWELVSKEFDPSKGIYAVPLGLIGDALVYNRKLFSQAGLDPDDPPTTYEELIEDCKAFMKASIVCLAGGNAEGYVSEWWLTFLWGGSLSGQDAVALGANNKKWTDPAVRDVVERYIRLVKAGYFGPGFASTPAFPDAQSAFTEGERPIGAGPFGVYTPPDAVTRLGEDLGVVVGLGLGQGSEPVSKGFSPHLAFSITSYSDEKDIAWEWIKFVASADSQRLYHRLTGRLPNHVDAGLSDEAPNISKGFFAAYQETAQEGGPSVAPQSQLVVDGGILLEFRRLMQLVVNGDRDLDEVLKEIQASQDRELG
jgi:ABC-type glycerol-3-phosphate transport system substrate-binding protein